ncbi:uncharacterized protein [Dendrobates tinctorius]|uniref:uncharacterized protein isoform X3 n=1 Tax=Dendrobates tinctorius TaxID=92724 RepID=UPI003CC9749E
MFLHELRVCLGRRRAEQCACAGATAEVRRRMASYGDGRRRTATPIGPDPRVLWVSSIFSVVPSLDANSSCVLFPPSGVLEPPPSVFCQDSCDPAPLRCQMSLRSPIFPSLHFSWLARGLNMGSSKIQAIIDWPVPGNIKEVTMWGCAPEDWRREKSAENSCGCEKSSWHLVKMEIRRNHSIREDVTY